MSSDDTTAAQQALIQLAEVKGQLAMLSTLISNSSDATNRRIEDLTRSTERRFDAIDSRIGTLEERERTTAIRTAGLASITSALTSAVVTAGLALIKRN